MADKEEQPLPPHVTTPLLNLIAGRSMDEDYSHVAQQRAAAGEGPPDSSRLRWVSLLVVGVLGLLTTVVAVQTDRQEEVAQLSRAAVIEQIESRRAQLGSLKSSVSELNDSNQSSLARAAQLDSQVDAVTDTVSRLEVRTGFSEVHGEGLLITVDNQPGVEVDAEIRDVDLATLVDGLWSAGAEAIAINEQRLSVLGGIRNTGRAIHVNGRPVNPPYKIKVIGDNQTLQARLLRSSQGGEWFTLVNGLGFRYAPQNVDDIVLPAAPAPDLRDVVELRTGPSGGLPGEEKAP